MRNVLIGVSEAALYFLDKIPCSVWKYVMAPTGGLKDSGVVWSECSRKAILPTIFRKRKFHESVKCLAACFPKKLS
jgi:hypothetical protein